MNIHDKVAIVTGGAQGLGKSICKALLDSGMKVLICDVKEPSENSFKAEDNIIHQKCDVSSFEEFKAAFDKAKTTFGRIDVVINNAGILNEKQWKRMIDINFIGVINGINLAFEFMGINNGGIGGCVINTASNAGLHGFPLAPIYSGCKHAIVGLTRSYGSEYHFNKTRVSVNAVCPGPIDTPLFHDFPKCTLDEETAKMHNSQMHPISPDEVAKAVIKLMNDGKNGALLTVNYEGMKYVDE